MWGRLALGRLWTVATSFGVRLHDRHRLVQTGPYAFVRHPMYLGSWLLLLGLLLTYRTWALVLFLTVALVSFSMRARREEEALEAVFGDEWRAYRATGATMGGGVASTQN